MKNAGIPAALSALALTGCSDPQLTLDLVIQEPYRSKIQSVDLQVLIPPIARPYTCDDLAFGRLDPMVVTLTRVGETSSDSLRTPISDISRTASKIFVADGYDPDKKRLVTGCVAVGEIKKDTTVQIAAEPVTHVTAPPDLSISTTLGQPPANPVVIPVKDLLDSPLPNIAVVWAIEAAAGIGSNGTAMTDGQGNASLNLSLPNRPGPFVLDVRVRWADGPPEIISGFVLPQPMPFDATARALSYGSGAIGPGKEHGLAVLLQDAGGDRVGLLYREQGSGRPALKTTPRIGPTAALGVIDQAGRDRDHVIAVGLNAWDEIMPDGTLAQKNYTTPAMATVPTRILTTGSCSSDPSQDPPHVLIEYAEDLFAIFSGDGGSADPFSLSSATNPTPVHVVATGCLSDQNAQLERTWAVDFGGGIGVVLVAPRLNMTPLFTSWLTLPQGIAFSPHVGMTDRRLVFGTQISVNDIVVSRGTFVHDVDPMEKLSISIEGFDAVPNVPLVTAAGDIDGDGLVDVVSLFRRPGATPAQDRDAIWAALGREHGTRRISGDVDLGMSSLRNPTLLVTDLDGDGSDDIIVGEVVPKAGDANATILVYFMGAR